MVEEADPVGTPAESAAGPLKTITREQLYEMVWTTPMVRVALQFDVSASYMARVCNELGVPRPARGHWAKLSFDKASPKPPLPEARPGDVEVWTRDQALRGAQPILFEPRAEATRPAAARVSKVQRDETHELVRGVRHHFTKTRPSDVGLLRPFKRLLVDIVVSEALLDDTLQVANTLFQALTFRGHRVTFAPPNTRMRRAPFDEREVPKPGHYHRAVWSPDRITVAYVDGVPIGLTLFEMTEEVEVMYISGDYVPVRSLTPERLKRLKGPGHWTTRKSTASGRRCLLAYCPHWPVSWTKEWRETKPGQLPRFFSDVVNELETVAPELTKRILEAQEAAAAQRREWEAQRERERIEAESKRVAQARLDARADLFTAIAGWDEARRMHAYFDAATADAHRLDVSGRAAVLERIEKARELIGPLDALEALRNWKAPDER